MKRHKPKRRPRKAIPRVANPPQTLTDAARIIVQTQRILLNVREAIDEQKEQHK